MQAFPAYSVDAQELSTRAFLKKTLKEPLLAEMLLCPTCYCGSTRSTTLTCPPSSCSLMPFSGKDCLVLRKGFRSILDQMTRKLKKLGVNRKMRASVRKIHLSGDRVSCVELESGETFLRKRWCQPAVRWKLRKMLDERLSAKNLEEGRFTIVESMSVYEGSPRDFD